MIDYRMLEMLNWVVVNESSQDGNRLLRIGRKAGSPKANLVDLSPFHMELLEDTLDADLIGEMQGLLWFRRRK